MGSLGFEYFDANGSRITDESELTRIKKLAVPPAWKDVWICPSPRGHLQATGRDARGRKQYRYHTRWRVVRDETKYDRTLIFGDALPGIRARTERDLALPGLPREKVLATVVQLLEKTLIRVGNDEYAKANNSFGLTTLRDKHVDVNGSKVCFEFRGKSGRSHTISVANRKLAAIVRRCRDLPGYELFQYVDEAGNRQVVDSADVNAYLREISGEDFSAKDFRTWAGTVLVARALQTLEMPQSQTHTKRNLTQAVQAVAAVMGNTPSICRKSYMHPVVLDAYLDGSLIETLGQRADEALDRIDDLQPDERRVLSFLRARLKNGAAA
jgi:DNA topoisomerase-1